MENEDFVLVVKDDGTLCYDDDGDVLVQRVSDGKQFYVPQTNISYTSNNEIMQDDNHQTEGTRHWSRNQILSQTNISYTSNNESMQDDNDQTEGTRHWSRDQILFLINLYKENKARFASSTVKNIKVWQKIAADLGSHNAKQCENKFKYLRSKYLQKKDNMSQNSSGACNINFEYFQEMDAIFRQEPIVHPIAIASSSRDNSVVNSSLLEITDPLTQSPQLNNNEAVESNSGPRTRRSIKLKEAINNLTNILKDAEADKHSRHDELLQVLRENSTNFNNFMTKFLEKM